MPERLFLRLEDDPLHGPEADVPAGSLRAFAVPGSIEQTADEVTQAGGRGIAVQCDHTREDDVAALFARVQGEAGRLDLLVNNAWGGHETFNGVFEAPFWEHPLNNWDSMFDRGVRNHFLGRAVAALAGDANVMARSGGVHRVADLARAYDFTDIDGRQVEAFEI